MAKLIGIYGEPGSGKSTSLRNLPPDQTFYVDADGKGLNWKGWRKQYSAEKKNYCRTSYPQTVISLLQKMDDYKDEKGNVTKGHKEFKYFVVDTVGNLMVSDEMRRIKEKGYDKWADLAACIWALVDMPSSLRDDLTVILLFHAQTETTDDGYRFTRIKTNGRKTEKNSIDSKFNWLLRTIKMDDDYFFEVTANESTSRTPLDAFSDKYVPNDIMEILKVVEEY